MFYVREAKNLPLFKRGIEGDFLSVISIGLASYQLEGNPDAAHCSKFAT
jgi:hypothetical protein